MKIEAEINKVVDYRVRPHKKKPYILEYRSTRKFFLRRTSKWRKWRKWSSYATIRDRDQALANLQRKTDWYEFRIPPVSKNI